MKLYPHNGAWCGESAYHPDDPLTGAEIVQLTGNVSISTNIYCEDPACSPDGRIAVVRSQWCNADAPAQLWLVDVAGRRSVMVDTDMSWSGACPQAYGDLFFYPRFRDGRREIVRLRMSSMEKDVVYDLGDDESTFTKLGSASPDGAFLVASRCHSDGRHETFIVELASGRTWPVAIGEDYFNSHPRFDRMDGQYLLIQHNRGQRRVGGGLAQSLVRTEGTTLRLARRDGSESRELPVARPAIAQAVSGHEAWLKGQAAFIYSLSPLDDPHNDGRRVGNLMLYRIGDDRPSVIADAPDLYFGHVSSSSCGCYWVCDAFPWKRDGSDACRTAPRIAVGCINTGKWAFVCEAGGGVWARYENGHAHPILTADNRYVIFTSMRTGLPQVFSATIPSGMLEDLAKPQP